MFKDQEGKGEYLVQRVGADLPRDLAEWWETRPQEVRETINMLRELLRETKRLNHETRSLLASGYQQDIQEIEARVKEIETKMGTAVINWHGQTEKGDW